MQKNEVNYKQGKLSTMDDVESKEILKKLEELARSPGFLYVIAWLTHQDMFYAPEEAAEINWRERVTESELELLSGYMIKSSSLSESIPTVDEIKKTISEVRDLLDKLHGIQSMKLINKFPESIAAVQEMTETETEEFRRQLFGAGEHMVEPIFYGDSGAYDFQYLNLVEGLYLHDSKWLKSKDHDLELYAIYAAALKQLITAKASVLPAESDNPQDTLGIFTFSAAELSDTASKVTKKDPRIDIASARQFINLFKSTPGEPTNKDYQAPGDRNSLSAFPIIELPDGQFFLNSSFRLAESIYNLPWIWMLQDKAYRNTADTNRGKNVEQLAHTLLSRSFDKVYHSVKVKRGSTVLTDIDGLALIGNKAIIFQEKSKWLTDLSKKGNEASLKDDFKKAIQDAYDQGLASREALLNQDGILFELPDGTLIEPGQTIDEAYIVCVTASVYPAQIVQVSQYLEKKPEDPTPIAISLLDLDLMTNYLPDAYDFLFYIKQRTELSDKIVSASEIALLGYHLKYRLYAGEKNERLMISEDFGQLIDADIMHKSGLSGEPSKKDRLRPQTDNKLFERIVDELKTIDEPRITDVIMFLMGLSEDTINEFMKYAQQCVNTVSRGKRSVTDFSATIDGEYGGFTFVAALEEEKMAETMNLLAAKNKYQHKANRWVALGANARGMRLISGVQYLDQPWENDPDMDKVLAAFKKHENGDSRKQKASGKTPSKKQPKRKKRPNKRNKRKK